MASASAAAGSRNLESREDTPLLRAGEVPVQTTEKARVVANGILLCAVAGTFLSLGLLQDKGWWVLGLTMLVGVETYAWGRLNLDAETRKLAVRMIANLVYELYLPLYTVANSKPKNSFYQNLPLLPLALGTGSALEFASEAVEDTNRQIVDRDSDIVQPPAGQRLYGYYPMTSETVKYCLLQIPLIAGGITCAVLGSRTSGIPQYLLLSNGYRLLAGGTGAICKNLYDRLMTAQKATDRSRQVPYRTSTVGLMALNTLVMGLSRVGAPLNYAIAKISGIMPLMVATGFMEGMLRADAQRMHETYGRNPPAILSPSQQFAIKIVMWSASGIFSVLLGGYTIHGAIKENDGPTYGAMGGIFGAYVGAFALSMGSQWFWNRSPDPGAFNYLTRLFLSEYPNWFAYLASDFDHVRNMPNATDSQIIAALTQTGGLVGLDLARGFDFLRVSQGVAPFGSIVLTSEAALVPSIFSNRTG